MNQLSNDVYLNGFLEALEQSSNVFLFLHQITVQISKVIKSYNKIIVKSKETKKIEKYKNNYIIILKSWKHTSKQCILAKKKCQDPQHRSCS